jgi:serine/threonine-protein kinase
MDPQVGQLINNKYRLVRLIGDGGMGSVWEAHHEMLGTTVALKFLHAALARRKGLVERFLQEARVSARIKSPNVVLVSDVDRTPDGLAYMVMEFIEGETLQTLYERNYQQGKRLSYGDAFTYFLQMLDGVAGAHRLGIVHRDLKPDNVMLSRDAKGRPLVKLLDFGIAKLKASGEVDRGLTRPGVVMGTPEYMAPEQAFSADRVDARADIFSLGVMFFEMLAGRRPVGGDNAHAIAAQYLEGSIAQLRELSPKITPELANAVHKAMAAKPEDRYQTVEEFRDSVEAFAPEGPRSLRRAQSSVPKTMGPEEPSAVEAGFENTAPTDEEPETRAVHQRELEEGRTEDISGALLDGVRPASSGTENDGVVRAGTEPMPNDAMAAAVRGGTAQMQAHDDKRDTPSGTVVGEPFATPVGPHGYGHGMPHSPSGAVGGVEGGEPYAPMATPGPAVGPGRRARKSGPSLLSILLIATVVSGAVVGGLYFAHRQSLEEEADNPRTKPRPTQVAPDPQPVTEPPSPEPPPPVAEPVPQPPTSPQPGPQPPRPNPKTQPKPQPSSEPPPPPPFIPTVLPSEIPIPPIFQLPGQIQPQPQPPAQPQPQPQPPPPPVFRPSKMPKTQPPPSPQPQPPAPQKPKFKFPSQKSQPPEQTNELPRPVFRPRPIKRHGSFRTLQPINGE